MLAAVPIAAPVAVAGAAAPVDLTGAVARAGTAHSGPTPAQMQAAIRRAERSGALWATVNICDTRRFPNTLGVRGQIPAPGFRSSMSLEIQVNYYSRSKHRFVASPSRHARTIVSLPPSSTSLLQGGWMFPFARHTGRLDATVEFVWRRSGRLLGETARMTTTGHRDADFGDPPHFSAAQCRIG